MNVSFFNPRLISVQRTQKPTRQKVQHRLLKFLKKANCLCGILGLIKDCLLTEFKSLISDNVQLLLNFYLNLDAVGIVTKK